MHLWSFTQIQHRKKGLCLFNNAVNGLTLLEKKATDLDKNFVKYSLFVLTKQSTLHQTYL